MHADGATGPDGFQEVLGRRRRGKNKERMAKLIASESRVSDESGDEGAAYMSKPQVPHTKINCDLPLWRLATRFSLFGGGLVAVQFPNLYCLT